MSTASFTFGSPSRVMKTETARLLADFSPFEDDAVNATTQKRSVNQHVVVSKRVEASRLVKFVIVGEKNVETNTPELP